MKKRYVFCLLLVCVMILSCSCGRKGTSGNQGTNGADTSDGGSVIVGITNDMDSLDPHKAVAAGTMEVLYNVFDGLVKVAPDGSMQPALAKSYRISEDAKTITFTLRDDVKFHNGEALTAEDVIYSLKRVAGMTDEKDIKVVSAFSIISDITESKGADNSTEVIVSLSEADTEMIYYLNTPIVKKGYEQNATNPVGTGPFRFESYKPMESIVIARNDNYYGEAAKLAKVTFKIFGSTDDAFMELLSGKVDIYPYLSSDEADQLKGGYRIISGDQSLIQGLYFNNANDKLKDVRVRQAINYAIDRVDISNLLTAGYSTIINTCMFPSFKKYYNTELNGMYDYNIDKAKELLKEAGYENGMDLEITIPSNYQFHISTGEILVSQLKKVGINAKIKQVDWSTWLSEVYTDRNYETTIIGFDASMAPGDVLERYQSTHKRNLTNYVNADYDKTYAAAKAALDENEKSKLYKDCQKMLTEDAVSAYIMAPALIVAVNVKLDGYTFYPIYFMDMSKVYYREN